MGRYDLRSSTVAYQHVYVNYAAKHTEVIRMHPLTWEEDTARLSYKKEYERLHSLRREGNRFVISFLCIRKSGSYTGHCNLLIWDREMKTVTRFDPFGYNPMRGLKKNVLSVYPPGTRYITSSIPMGLQRIEHYGKPYTKEDLPGYCAIWCVWFIRQRLRYPQLTVNEIIERTIYNWIKYDRCPRRIIRRCAIRMLTDNK